MEIIGTFAMDRTSLYVKIIMSIMAYATKLPFYGGVPKLLLANLSLVRNKAISTEYPVRINLVTVIDYTRARESL